MALKKRTHLSLLLQLLLIYSSFAVPSAGSDDAKAMWELAKGLSGAPTSWKQGSDPCDNSWERVTCSSDRVTIINLPSQSLSGTLSDALSRLTALQKLFLQNNQISGPLPSLPNLSSLQELHVDGNALSSVPPGFFSGLSGLTSVSLDDNPFSPWAIPDDLAQITTLQTFSASNASVTGAVPPFFGSLLSLRDLSLSYNKLTGGLPETFAGSSIQSLRLNNQQSDVKLSGRIDVIGAMTQLNLVWLQSNAFTGPIPDLSNLSSLTYFNVRDNSLTGVVPSSLTSSPTLNEVALSNNKLQGPFPEFASKNITLDIDKGNSFCSPTPGPCDLQVTALLAVAAGFGYPLSLASSWEGNNPCAGGWTGIVCDAQGKNVIVLNFANRHFNGTISPNIANLTSLTKLVLNNNALTGLIPDSLTSLPQLQLLDVTNNNLAGEVPSFKPNVVLKISGNPLLGSKSSSPGGSGSSGGSISPLDGTSMPSSQNQSGKSSSSSAGMIVGVVIAAVVFIGCCVGLFSYLRHKKQSQKFGRVQTQTPPNEPEMIKMGIAGRNVNNGSVSELYSHSSAVRMNIHTIENQGMIMSIQSLRAATNNFSEDNILGRGGFGVVYKGVLDGTLVAVKRNESDSMGQKGMAEFQAEIDVLKKVRHRHLVALLGYCMDGAEQLLVYEYMSEGTLGQHLFDQGDDRYSILSWKQRLTIALDVARGIEYLHSLAQESFIHRDLKPSNILLDKDMRAKVSDFGLVKLADTQKSMMTRLAGTFGYLAPEYALTGKVSTKVDVYAFGVILMELIMGRRALEESLPEEQTHLVTYFRRIILDQVRFMKSVDPTLNLDEEGQKSILEVAELARHCTAREPSQRPDMGHAVNVLAPLVDQWKPTCSNEEDIGASGISLSQRLENWQLDDCSSTTELFSGYKGSSDTTCGKYLA